MSVTAPTDLDAEAGLQEMEEKLPGMAALLEPDDPAMHTTDTIDFAYVISGEVWLELHNGEEVHLKAGDTLIQNGTRYAWRNKSSELLVACRFGIADQALLAGFEKLLTPAVIYTLADALSPTWFSDCLLTP